MNVNEYHICPGANLVGANLLGADLRNAHLEGAKLAGANLEGADLRDANLWSADLRRADLEGANLRAADLKGANLRGANLRGALLLNANLMLSYLRDANLEGADLRGANLRGAGLECANLQGANLEGADLVDSDLVGACVVGFRGAPKPCSMVPPPAGEFVGWKKLDGGVICKLLIPADAQRFGGYVSHKCRASHAVVLDGEGWSAHDPCFNYSIGCVVGPTRDFDTNPFVECSTGIHFFMTRGEAEAYQP